MNSWTGSLILNQAHLRAVLADYQEHYNTARPIRASASACRRVTLVPASLPQTPARARSAENGS